MIAGVLSTTLLLNVLRVHSSKYAKIHVPTDYPNLLIRFVGHANDRLCNYDKLSQPGSYVLHPSKRLDKFRL